MMILFTIVQNQTKPRYIKEVYLGGKRIRQTIVIPRMVMECDREVGMGMGMGRQVFHNCTWE